MELFISLSSKDEDATLLKKLLIDDVPLMERINWRGWLEEKEVVDPEAPKHMLSAFQKIIGSYTDKGVSASDTLLPGNYACD